MTLSSAENPQTALIVGASRGLGQAMAAEFVTRGWNVVGTVRGDARTRLHDLADQHPGRVMIEPLDITAPEQIAALSARLSNRSFDIAFVNAGTANNRRGETVADIATEDFVRVMLTNVLGVMRTVEGLQGLVQRDGLIGVMSSGQGSITNNTNGREEIYRSSKAALNQCMRSYAARHADDQQAMVLMAPGWIRTDLGGPDAPFSIEEAIPDVVGVLIAQQGQPGLRYLDRFGQTVPW